MKNNERREHARLRPKKLTFVALRPDFIKLGKIIDISKGGLCFQYMAKEDQDDGNTSLSVDMFISDNGYYLPGIPCRLIRDIKMEEGMTFPIGLEYRLCGLQFGKLKKEQRSQLDHYLKDHTAGIA